MCALGPLTQKPINDQLSLLLLLRADPISLLSLSNLLFLYSCVSWQRRALHPKTRNLKLPTSITLTLYLVVHVCFSSYLIIFFDAASSIRPGILNLVCVEQM